MPVSTVKENDERPWIQPDRLKMAVRLASGLAHELGTPLNVVSGRARLISSGELSEAEIRLSANTIEHEVSRMATVIGQLLEFARCRPPRRVTVDLWNVVNQAATRLDSLANDHDATISVSVRGRPCLAKVDAGQIEQVMDNLIVNAVQAVPDGGRVDVQVMSTHESSADHANSTEVEYVRISVRDDGTGIAEQHMPHLFEPFFTTKALGEGTGLGLSIAYGIVREHGGYIETQSTEGEGSCFTVFLPAGEPA